MTGDPLCTETSRVAAVARLWQVFGRRRVSGAVQVCTCPVCMTAEDLARLKAIPAPDLPVGLIREYTASAHGVPDPPDDLKVLLPRYLELLSAGVCCDVLSLDCDLRRFGAAMRALPGVFSAAERAALDGWLAAETGVMARAPEPRPLSLMNLALSGPWPAATVLAAIGAALGGSSPLVLAALARELLPEVRWRHDRVTLDLMALETLTDPERMEVADWLNSEALQLRLLAAGEALADAGLSPHTEAAVALESLFELTGRFDAALFPRRR